VDIPKTDTQFKDKQGAGGSPGNNFREDFAAIRLYVDEVKPVLVGVDGGADVLLDFGYVPDVS